MAHSRPEFPRAALRSQDTYVQAYLQKYFDNEGVNFNAATMPDLIDRVPDHTRLESTLAYSSSGNP